MRRLLFILILFPLLISGQTIISKQSSRSSRYFPPSTFDCNKIHDEIGNDYWSGYLASFKKHKLYKDTSYAEFYRLIHYGNFIAIVEVFRENEKYVIIADSLGNDNTIRRKCDTLSAEVFRYQADSLNSLLGRLWKIRSYEHCSSENYVPIIDDRDNWVIEMKNGNKYHAINRIVATSDLISMITLLMNFGRFKGYLIYYDNSNYKKY